MSSATIKKIIPCKKEQLIEMVLDIEKYPEFVPWCIEGRVYGKIENNDLVTFKSKIFLNQTSKSKTALVLDKSYLFQNKTKYGIQAVFDPCSYPGIQCRIFFDKNNNLLNVKCDGGRVSFMIFRTGSVLIVGKCDMVVLNKIYEYIKKILEDEYSEIYESDKIIENKTVVKKKIKKKVTITK